MVVRSHMLVLALNHLLYFCDASFMYHIHFSTNNLDIVLQVLINFTFVRRADPAGIDSQIEFGPRVSVYILCYRTF
jgi:hypothetical protein